MSEPHFCYLLTSIAANKYYELGSKISQRGLRGQIIQRFISSNFLHYSIVWHFCSSQYTYEMQKESIMQKRALWVVLYDYQSSYKDLLKEVNRSTLYVSRMNTIGMFKCVKSIGPSFLRNVCTFQEQPYDLSRGCKFIQPMVRTDFGINAFLYEGTNVWNILPDYLNDASEVGEFNQLIQQWSGPTCQCEYCILCNVNKL